MFFFHIGIYKNNQLNWKKYKKKKLNSTYDKNFAKFYK